jgi:hypothetical protein
MPLTHTHSHRRVAVTKLRAIRPAANTLECSGCGATFYSASPRAVLLRRPPCERCGGGLERATDNDRVRAM